MEITTLEELATAINDKCPWLHCSVKGAGFLITHKKHDGKILIWKRPRMKWKTVYYGILKSPGDRRLKYINRHSLKYINEKIRSILGGDKAVVPDAFPSGIKEG